MVQNAFMTAKEKARKSGAESFEYTNKDGVKKTYYKKKTKTGMVIYGSKKSGTSEKDTKSHKKATKKATKNIILEEIKSIHLQTLPVHYQQKMEAVV